MNLAVIYHFQSSQDEMGEFSPAQYQVVYSFSGVGFVPGNVLKEALQSIPENTSTDLTFQTLDELKSFSLKLAEILDEDEVRLISVQDLNVGIDGARDLSGFRQIFMGFGESLKREGVSRKKNFLSRFF